MLVKSTAPEPGFLVTSLALRDSRQLFKSPRPQCLYSQKENNDCSYSTAFSHNQRRYCRHKGRVCSSHFDAEDGARALGGEGSEPPSHCYQGVVPSVLGLWGLCSLFHSSNGVDS